MNAPKRLIRFSATLLLAACSPHGLTSAQQANMATSASESVALTVNGTAISQREVDMLVRQQPPQHDAPTARQHVIDNITMQTIVAQEAVKRGLDKSPDVVDQLAMAKTSVYAQAYIRDYFQNQKVSDAEINAAYEKLKSDAAAKQYQARHILVKTKDEGDTLIAQLKKNPSSFDQLAASVSLDPVTKAKGGELGWFETRNMDPNFSAAVTNLKKGEITPEPVKSQFGYHVILLEDIRSKNDSVPPLDQVRASLIDQIRQNELRAMLENLKSHAKIERPAATSAT